jgi:hypothetical protein
MNKKSKSKSKRKTSSTRRKIKQVGCSLKRRLTQSGGDAYNAMPASKIYPLEDYSVDSQRANIDARQQLGGSSKKSNEGRSFRKYSRKYYKKISGGSNASYFDMTKSFDANALDKLYNKAAPFYV